MYRPAMLIHGVAWGCTGPIYSCLEAPSENTPSTEGLFAARRANSALFVPTCPRIGIILRQGSTNLNKNHQGKRLQSSRKNTLPLLPYPLLFPSFSYWCWAGETSADMEPSSPARPFQRLQEASALHQPSACSLAARKGNGGHNLFYN